MRDFEFQFPGGLALAVLALIAYAIFACWGTPERICLSNGNPMPHCDPGAEPGWDAEAWNDVAPGEVQF